MTLAIIWKPSFIRFSGKRAKELDNADKHRILKGKGKELGWGAVRLLTSLALLPENLIKEGFQIIANVIFQDYKYLKSFINYYEATWINGFKPYSFCVFRQMHKTNNISERHNRELKESLKKHSTIIDFLEHQKDVQSFMKHPKFWARLERDTLKLKENELQKIWLEIETNTENLNLLLILNKLSEFVGEKNK